MTIAGSDSAKPGEVAALKIKVEGDLTDRQLVRIEVQGPDGKPRPAYSTILWIPAAGGVYEIPLALNDSQGQWRIKAVHVVSGMVGERVLSVVAGQ